MQKIQRLINLFSALIELIIREKRLPQRLTENYFFHAPGYIVRRFQHQLKSIKSDTPVVYLPHVGQRYVFQILHLLSLAYPEVIFLWDFNINNYIKLGYEGRRLFSLKNVKIVPPASYKLPTEVVVSPDNNQSEFLKITAAKKQIIIENDVSQEPKQDSFMLPYGVHPYFLQNYAEFNSSIKKLRSQDRAISVLFSGATAFVIDKYLVERYYHVPSRDRCVEFLTENSTRLNIAIIQEFPERKKFNDNPGRYKDYSLVLCKCKGLPEKWLDELSTANFFLALPGSHMLMCHNAIEAMAVGTIPIISYENWFFPNLINGENCLTYKSLEELPLVIAYANQLEKTVIEKMRKAVMDYYDNYLNLVEVVNFIKNYQGCQLHLYINHEDAETLRNLTDKSIITRGGSLQTFLSIPR
ncbi:hypothetical protein [Nostoc sp. FACHB-280]|uniref:hypothetical protein n=1 Tax=Nostoc sp. FACHB-280 TaxID=2692839 RepID=UPI00168B23B7|nr:hypothetical protein [Nostoc sp. FACHB-280]MBD2493039.1 hypothetical protein [Nostoc sp. FACHB-280]